MYGTEEGRGSGDIPAELDDLQLALLRSLASGMSQAQAARAARVSEATMRRAIRGAREAMGASTTIRAVYLAAKRGLI
ncbi:MAG TPA: hypothetical protein VNC78_03115 [Actinomycetota bacterium]|nr:hypothetical protein [Actinomycetota bacterium]